MGRFDGRCLCGSLTYTSTAEEPMFSGICHCKDCQRASGSAFSVVVAVPLDTLDIQGDTLKVFDTMGEDRGELAHRSFCTDCGSPILSTLDDMPGVAVLKTGTLDDTSWLQPELELWTSSAQHWATPEQQEGRTCLPRGFPEGS